VIDAHDAAAVNDALVQARQSVQALYRNVDQIVEAFLDRIVVATGALRF
jgi:hypothetical protein